MHKFTTPLVFLSEGRTITGRQLVSALASYDDLYRRRFTESLARYGVCSEEKLIAALLAADGYETVGDFLTNAAEQEIEVSAFGLVLFDRMAAAWGQLDNEELFFMHEQLFECFDLIGVSMARTEEVRRRALKQHAKNRDAKRFAIEQWIKYRGEYGGNKSAFVRDYKARIANEMGVVITEKQMREEWLKDIPAAGSPDGVQADGE